jgi:hypothetical protein
MKLRAFVILITVALALTVGAGQALAGGWAVTSVDSAPQEFVAGQTYDVEYSVLQHGIHPTTSNGSSMQLVNEATGQVLTFPGEPNAATGRYVAQITAPQEGSWSWSASSGFGEQELGTLQVAAAHETTALWTSTTTRLALTFAFVVLAALLILQAVSLRRESVRARLPQPVVLSGAGGD